MAQQSIAGYVPAGVIDDLELIQIEIEQRVLDTLLADKTDVGERGEAEALRKRLGQ